MLFIKKNISDLQAEADGHHGLKRTLGPAALVSLGIGAIIGAGLFSITGSAAANHAGPAITISFVIAAIACAFAGLCYAELASMIPVAGSAYTYSYATMGEFVAWIIGWDLVLEYAVGAATVAISWSGYLRKLLHMWDLDLPVQYALSPFETYTNAAGETAHGFVNFPAVAIVVLASMILIRGTRESATVNTIIVALKVAIVLVFIVVGWNFIKPENYTPYIPSAGVSFGDYGWGGILTAAGIIFFAYIGFDAVSTAAQEAKNPKRDMPIGILVSLAICTVLYILFAHVLTGMANYKEFAGHDGIAPVAIAIAKTGPGFEWLQQGIVIAILAGFTSVIMVMLLGQSRVFFSMSKDGLLPKVFSDIHPKFGTPWRSNLLFCLFVSLFAAFVPANVVGHMTSIGTLFAFILVCAGVWVLRVQEPNRERAFKTPLVPLVPILGILTCLAMMIPLGWETWGRLVGWLAVGIIIYFTYGVKNSVLRRRALGKR